jgi:hypothetical protein
MWVGHYERWCLRSQSLEYALSNLGARILEWHPRQTIEGTDLDDAITKGEKAIKEL